MRAAVVERDTKREVYDQLVRAAEVKRTAHRAMMGGRRSIRMIDGEDNVVETTRAAKRVEFEQTVRAAEAEVLADALG